MIKYMGALFGKYGEMRNSIVYTPWALYPSVVGGMNPTYDLWKPLVVYLDVNGNDKGDWFAPAVWMYDLSQSYAAQSRKGRIPNYAEGITNLNKVQFGQGGWFDQLNKLVGDYKIKFNQPDYIFNVILTGIYPYDAPNRLQEGIKETIDAWASKQYQHLTLAGFNFGEDGFDGQAATNMKAAISYVHGLNLDILMCWEPWSLKEYPASDGSTWKSWGWDIINYQLTWQYRCDVRALDGTPSNQWDERDRAIKSGLVQGIQFQTGDYAAAYGGTNCYIPTTPEATAKQLDEAYNHGWQNNIHNSHYRANYYIGDFWNGGKLMSAEPLVCGMLGGAVKCRKIYDDLYTFMHAGQAPSPPVTYSYRLRVEGNGMISLFSDIFSGPQTTTNETVLTIPKSTKVQVLAEPAPGWTFKGFGVIDNGQVQVSTNPFFETVNADTLIIAYFTELPPAPPTPQPMGQLTKSFMIVGGSLILKEIIKDVTK